jgi:hypothetical protein
MRLPKTEIFFSDQTDRFGSWCVVEQQTAEPQNFEGWNRSRSAGAAWRFVF